MREDAIHARHTIRFKDSLGYHNNTIILCYYKCKRKAILLFGFPGPQDGTSALLGPFSLRLEAGHGAARRSSEHGEQGFHQSDCAGDANAVNNGHFPIFIPLRV
jgi:hypothetical protein